MKVDWTRLAEDQVTDAFTYIASDRPASALKWFGRLVDSVGSLSTLPDQGRMVPEANRASIREILVDPYRVVYRRDKSRVVILTVQHQRRDLDLGDAEL